MLAFFGANPEALQAAGLTKPELSVDPPVPTATVDPAIAQQIEDMKAKTANMANAAAHTAATSFVDTLLRANKIIPAQNANGELATLFVAAAKADGGGDIAFGPTGIVEGPNLKALRASFDNAQPHALTQEQIQGSDPNATKNAKTEAQLKAERDAYFSTQPTLKEAVK